MIMLMTMDYELVLDNQAELNRESGKSLTSKTNWNDNDIEEVADCEAVFTDQLSSTNCDKDIDFDMITKSCDNSSTEKDEDCSVKVKLQEKSDPTFTNSEISQSREVLPDNAVIDGDEDYSIESKYREICDMIEGDKMNELLRNGSNILNVDCDKMNNVNCGEDSDAFNMFQQESNNDNSVVKDENLDTDNFDIMISDSDEEFQPWLEHKLPLVRTKRNNKRVMCLPYSTIISEEKLKCETKMSQCEEKQTDDMNFQENELFVKNVGKGETNLRNEQFYSQEPCSGNSSSMKSNSSCKNDFGMILKSVSEEPSQIWSSDYLGSLQEKMTGGWNFDLQSSSSEKILKKQMPCESERDVSLSIYQPCSSSSLQLENIDCVDGLNPVNLNSSSSFSQSVSDAALYVCTLSRSCNNASLNQTVQLPTKGTLDNVMSDLIDSNSNQSVASFDSKTDPRSYAATQDIHVSPEYICKVESNDSSIHNRQKSKSCFDTEIFQYNCDSPIVITCTSPVSQSSLIPSQRSSISDSLHLKKKELDKSYETQVQSVDQKNVPKQTLLTTESSLPDLSLNNRVEDNQRGTVEPIQKPKMPDHTLECGNEKQSLSNVEGCKVTDNVHSIPSTSTNSSENVEDTEKNGVLETTREHFSTTQNYLAAEPTNSLVSLLQIPIFTPSNEKSVVNKRHIKSILNTYVNHRSKGQDYSKDDISGVADKLANVLKSSRKRSYSAAHTNTTKTVMKTDRDESGFTADTKDTSKKSKMDVDIVESLCTRPCVQKRKLEEEHDDIIRLCRVCDTSSPGSKSVKCRNSHVICQSCCEDEIRLVMASEKMYLSCPEESCKAVITLDSLSSILPSFIVDLLSDNLRLKEQKASAKAIKKMQELVICPHCSCPSLLEEQLLHFLCSTCHSNCCRYCMAPWISSEEHECCLLLSFVGTDCLKDISKLPQNWNMSLTPFNKNFVQVNVPLKSNEGSAVAAFFSKTASGKPHVVQIFRIQNLKLWEKYVLKRKHVADEIGVAELKEKFLFHGTKSENIVNICGEGFDMRVPTSNGALLGKGIYFSVTAKYSEKFADKSGMLFLSRVICGWSQHGQRQLTRPHYHGTSRRMYDSCVDNVSKPTMYTVFDNSQCYPEYLIHFTN